MKFDLTANSVHFVVYCSVRQGGRPWLDLQKLSAASSLLLVDCKLYKVVTSSLVLQLLQQRVGLALRGFDTVCPDDARGAVPVEHEDQLLSLQLQLLYLGFKVRV